VILGAGISLNFGVVVLLSMEIEGATKKPIIKLNQEKINKNCIFIDI
jgi:hypothetical protein